MLAHRPEYAPQSVVGVRFTDDSDRLVFKTIIQSRASPPGYYCCCRGHADDRYCCSWPFLRASRFLLGGLSSGPGCYCWGSHGASRESARCCYCAGSSLYFWLSCRVVIVEGKNEGSVWIVIVGAPSGLIAAWPSRLKLFVFLTLYIAFDVPVFSNPLIFR